MRINIFDQFKGIAIISIVLFHLGIFSGGFLGVDVFFLISGFFLTWSLVKNYNRGIIKNTYGTIKSICANILPGIFILVLIGLIYYRINVPPTFKTFNEQGISALYSINNWYNISNSVDYWGGVESIFTHLWFASVLIQIYIIYTMIASFLLKISRGKKNVLKFFLVIIATSILFYQIIMYKLEGFNRAYYGTDTRSLAFLIGALVCLLLLDENNMLKKNKNKYFSLVLIPIIIISIFTLWRVTDISNEMLFSIIIPANIILCSSLIYVCIVNGYYSVGIKFIDNILSFIGKNSIYLYLWHWPIIVILKEYGCKESLTIIFIIIILTIIIYSIFEKTPLFKKFIILKLVLILLVSIIIRERWIPVDAHKFTEETIVVQSSHKDAKTVLVVGDSWGRYLGSAMSQIAEEEKITVINEAMGGFGIMKPEYYVSYTGGTIKPTEYYYNYLEEWEKTIDEMNPDEVIIILGNYDQSVQVINGEKVRVGNEKFDALYIKNYKEIVDMFLRKGVRIVITNVNDNGRDTYSKEQADSLNAVSDNMRNNINKIYSHYKDNENIIFFDFDEVLSPNTKLAPTKTKDGRDIYDDTNHPTDEMCKEISKLILEKLRNY